MDLVNKNNFVDKTVLSTPEPKASSTTQKKKQFKSVYPHVSPEIDSDDSLGILSVKSEDLTSNMLDTNKAFLHKQRLLASNSLQKASRLSSLPSRYLRSSDISKNITESCLNVSSGSTISESDLLRNAGKTLYGDTSTPRTSYLCDKYSNHPEPRSSLGKSLVDLSHKIKNPNIELDSFTEEFQKLMQSQSVILEENSEMFTPAEAAEAKLLADELSWRKANVVPAQNNLCFEDNSLPLKISMGEFFKQKSDSISDLDIDSVSPEKQAPPVALIEYKPSLVTGEESRREESLRGESLRGESRSKYIQGCDTQNSLSVSKIAQILQDTEQTPQRAMNFLLNKGKKSNNNPNQTVPSNHNVDQHKKGRLSITKSVRNSTISPQLTHLSSESYSESFYNKENINSLNVRDSASYISAVSRSSPVQHSVNTTVMSRKSPDYLAQIDRSITSLRSASSLSNLINGKLPIEATKIEIIWGCVKPGKSLSQDVFIRNKSQNRLRIQCYVSGPSYKILKDRPDAEYVSIARYVLQPCESKTINVMFAPIQIGTAVDSLCFAPVDPNLQQHKPQKISLYGFGGHSNVEIDNITKDVAGRYWLCLGQLDNRAPLCKAVTVRNIGTLPAFVYCTFDSKDMYSVSTVNISPQRFVLMPQEQKEVFVTYTPSKEDLTHIQTSSSGSLIEVGHLKLISGAEVSRGRIRRLCEEAANKGLSVNQLCKKLTEHIPGEKMPSDLYLFKESIRSMTELIRDFPVKEISLTVEQDPDSTLLARFPDDTLYFQTLCQESTLNIDDVDKNSFKLEPTCIILSPPMKTEDMLLLTSEYHDAVHYNVKSESKNVILSHTAGVLKPGESVLIKVKYTGKADKIVMDKVSVIMEKCVLESVIKILQVR